MMMWAQSDHPRGWIREMARGLGGGITEGVGMHPWIRCCEVRVRMLCMVMLYKC